MKKFMMVTSDRTKFLLSEKEKIGVCQGILKGDKFVLLQGGMVPVTIPPLIMPYENWAAQENERLRVSGKRLCRLCGSVMEMETGCECWKKNGNQDKNPYQLPEIPEGIKMKLHGVVKDFPDALTLNP